MRTLPLAIALLAAACAEPTAPGAAFATAGPDASGATVTLFAERGPHCLHEARAALWASADRSRIVPGCWLLVGDGSVVIVAFLDGERADIPVARLVKVKAS